MDFIIRHFAIRGWKRVLYAFIFILLCWQLSRFWGNWKDGVSSIFYVIHAPIHEVGHTVAAMIHLPQTAVVLAGSLFQLLTPIAIGAYFVWHGDCPAISLCLGENLIHDFEYLFTRMHCLNQACRIGVATAAIGYAFVFIALALIIAMFVLGFLPRQTKEE